VRVRGATGAPDLLYCGDLFPTRSHLRIPWNMGYDLAPLTIVDEKRRLLEEADRGGHWLMLEHDPEVALVRIRFDGQQTETVETAALPGPADGLTRPEEDPDDS
jgi:glyoxylase-like metal-dependent hydrolase (beta-lactamase superfamily II)